MTIGTEKEINDQMVVVHNAGNVLMAAKLRLRALKGEALLQSGDSFSVDEIGDVMAALEREFGQRNIRIM